MDIILPDKEYFSIGDVSKITNLPQYVLRYWESEFAILKPQRRDSGHRKFTKKDITLINEIKELLYTKKFTIAGAKKHLASQKKDKTQQLQFELGESSIAIGLLKETKKTLQEVLKILK
ncbi:MAG: MerR family transcriptional regulator [Elusimicrobia bacterium]|nr:MerR family transcriptional regulator [Elusimicrobiota bacterium]MBU2614004.1 MerR family transcriptional regulator [Elusimicrobiota bacterium]